MLQQQQTRTNSRGEAYVFGPTGAPWAAYLSLDWLVF